MFVFCPLFCSRNALRCPIFPSLNVYIILILQILLSRNLPWPPPFHNHLEMISSFHCILYIPLYSLWYYIFLCSYPPLLQQLSADLAHLFLELLPDLVQLPGTAQTRERAEGEAGLAGQHSSSRPTGTASPPHWGPKIEPHVQPAPPCHFLASE